MTKYILRRRCSDDRYSHSAAAPRKIRPTFQSAWNCLFDFSFSKLNTKGAYSFFTQKSEFICGKRYITNKSGKYYRDKNFLEHNFFLESTMKIFLVSCDHDSFAACRLLNPYVQGIAWQVVSPEEPCRNARISRWFWCQCRASAPETRVRAARSGEWLRDLQKVKRLY